MAIQEGLCTDQSQRRSSTEICGKIAEVAEYMGQA